MNTARIRTSLSRLLVLLTMSSAMILVEHPAMASRSVVFVSKGGSDSAAGTSARPLRTISAAVARVGEGGTVVIRPGRYHESVTVTRRGITVRASKAGSVWLDGTRKVRGWRRVHDTWVADGWTAEFDHSPTYVRGAPDRWGFLRPDFPMAAHPDQVWVGKKRLQQVATTNDVGRGEFAVNYAANRLILGSSPRGKQVRASNRSRALRIVARGVDVEGINVWGYATSVPDMGSVTVERSHARLRRMRIEASATTGLFVGAPNVRVASVQLARNGLMGMLGNRAHRLRVRSVNAKRNNTEKFNFSPSAGGVKLTRLRDVEIKNSVFRRNSGTGLWLDESVYDMRIVNSRFLGNARHGMSLEISGKALVADNVVANNRGFGVKVNNTDQVQLWNNTFVGGGRPINIVQDWRDVDLKGSFRDWSLPLTLVTRHIKLRNNVISARSAKGNCLICVEDYTHRWSAKQLNVTSRGNLVHKTRIPRWMVVWSRGAGNPAVFSDVKHFRRVTGQRLGAVTTRDPVTKSRYRVTRRARAFNRVAIGLPPSVAKTIGRRAGARKVGSWQ